MLVACISFGIGTYITKVKRKLNQKNILGLLPTAYRTLMAEAHPTVSTQPPPSAINKMANSLLNFVPNLQAEAARRRPTGPTEN